MHGIAIAIASVAAALAIGPATASADPAADLHQARERWAARAASDYSYHVRFACFCPPIEGRIRVVHGRPRSTPAELRRYDTVQELFALVERSLATAASVRVRYAPNTGVPIRLSVDQRTQVADDEFSLTVSGIRAPRRP